MRVWKQLNMRSSNNLIKRSLWIFLEFDFSSGKENEKVKYQTRGKRVEKPKLTSFSSEEYENFFLISSIHSLLIFQNLFNELYVSPRYKKLI